MKSESSLETLENIVTKRREERVETFVADLLGLEEGRRMRVRDIERVGK